MSETVDYKKLAEEKVREKCVAQDEAYKQCAARITGPDGEYIKGKHCTGYALELWKCIDQHAAGIYFNQLK